MVEEESVQNVDVGTTHVAEERQHVERPLADMMHALQDAEDAFAEEVEELIDDAGSDEDALNELRMMLLGHYREQMVQVQETIEVLSERTSDKEALIRTITPVMGDLIRNKIRDNRDEMIEALYPIIGQLVVRAVSEAVRDLARKMDAQLRTTYSVSYQGRRLWARLNGVSESELILRDSLPFRIAEVFLIHKGSGLLLWHESLEAEQALADADLIGSMLTAIRDFTADAFGNNQEERLDEIQYGDHQILIEAAQHVYIAVVASGVEPTGFRSMLRRRVITIQNSHHHHLVSYEGDASVFAEVGGALGGQLTQMSTLSSEASSNQKTFGALLFGGVVVGLLLLLALYLWL